MIFASLNKILPFLAAFLLGLSLKAQSPADLSRPSLIWNGSELSASSAGFQRSWKLVDGLPSAISLRWPGREWLKSSDKPTTTFPEGWRMKPPFTVSWTTEESKELPIEATSIRGTLSVMGSDGRGYRWHLKVFAGLPSVTCQLERVGRGQSDARLELAAAAAGGIENPRASGVGTIPAVDLMELFNLPSENNELTMVTLSDVTDQNDNLAFERTWRLSPKERVQGKTNVCSIESPLTQEGLVLVKLAPLPEARPIKQGSDVIAGAQTVGFYGHAFGEMDLGYAWTVVGYTGGNFGRTRALHALQKQFHEFRPGRDGLMVSNTWGDRSQDSRITEAFVLAEIAAGHDFGVDVCQIDDGWQKGLTSNSVSKKGGLWEGGFWASDEQFWTPRPTAFPAGLQPVAAAARKAGMGLGLWFSPDAAQDYSNWERDASAVISFHDKWGVSKVKIDGMKIVTQQAERNFHAFVRKALVETKGELGFDLDITAGVRPGYFGLLEADLFVENRYSDWHNWWPHSSLRNLWQLSRYVEPQRLRMEFLNPTRNQAKYQGDPLAPSLYPPDYVVATTLFANPLAWFEVSNLPASARLPMQALVQTWKKYRDEVQGGTIFPIGECPSGAAWTGFCSTQDGFAHVLIFRERTVSDFSVLTLPPEVSGWGADVIAGKGSVSLDQTRLSVTIPTQLEYVWVRLSASKTKH